jgi:2-polyprenyl-3-methyl-5-hydroxy-6-metoxy-1,4-benzoquinol methylase
MVRGGIITIEERMIPGISAEHTLKAHIARYIFAQNYTENKIVLDAACGAGYGSLMLAENSAQVYGIDISDNALDMATKLYNAENIKYTKGDIRELPYSAEAFDIIVSFETIEHILQAPAVLREFSRVLKPGGLLIISTPNAAVSSPDGYIKNPYHIIEYSKNEFTNLLQLNFQTVQLYGQKPIVTIPILRRYLNHKSSVFQVKPFKNGLHKYSYFIAICTKGGF